MGQALGSLDELTDCSNPAIKAAYFGHLSIWLHLCQRISDDLDQEALSHFKVFFEKTLLPTILQSEFCKYCREKPRGYAGDFVMMEWIWTERTKAISEGLYPYCESAIGRLVSEFTFQHANCAANEYRVHYFTSILKNTVANRIASIGSGSAIEIRHAKDNLSEQVEIHLFDQDDGALAFAKQKLDRLSVKIHSGNVLRSIIKMPDSYFDCIYSSGLFDYLSMETSGRLVILLWKKLKIGGKLIITNADPNNPTRFWMEFVSDWFLVYKSKDQLFQIAENVPGNRYTCEPDPYGVYHYLTITNNNPLV